jgi:Secretion system C-terminal sorting domain
MKKILHNINGLRSLGVVLFFCLMSLKSFGQAVGDYGFVQTTATSGQYLAATLANWVVCQSAGTWVGATPATVAVGGSINAYIRNGTTCALAASTSFKNLTIDNGGALIAATGTTSGSPRGIRINGVIATLQIDGAVGGTGNSGVDGYLSIEPQTIGSTATVQGSGTCIISRARPSANTVTGITLKLNMDITLITTGQALSTNTAANTTIEIGVGKTVTIPSGYIAISNNPLTDPTTGADKFIVNIYGNVALQSATQGGINFSNNSANTMTVNIFKGATVTLGFKVIAPSSSATTGAMTLKIEEGATLTVAGADVSGATVIYSTATTGTTGASISALPTLTPVKNLTIDNTGGVTLSASTTVTNALTLTTGNLTLSANNITIGVAGSITGGSTTSHVVTDATGTLTQTFSAARLFPVGASPSSYDPVTIAPTAAATFAAKVYSTLTPGFNNAALANTKEWDITPTAAATATITLTPSNATNTATPVIGHFVGGVWTEATASLNVSSFTGTYSNFSPFATGSATAFVSAVLAVELTNLTAKSNGNTNLLAWKTANEKNNKEFQIERSANGLQFGSIGTVKGNGTTASASSYTFLDEGPLSISYYRLVSVDNNGKKETSNVVTVLRGANGKTKLFPTLVADKMTIVSDSNEPQSFNIFDLTGRNVHRGTFTTQQDVFVSDLATGTYLLKVGNDVVKFIKQ